jgi:membrane-associated protease RseP (regulator of RpoE activity)
MDVSLPYFIPVPFGLGTFGAFIRLHSPAENRTNLFDVAVSGPLAGLVVAIPTLVLGLRSSLFVPLETLPPESFPQEPMVHSSLLFATVLRLTVGPIPEAHALQLSPLAFAAWLGIYVTALNLVPVGQLDGGHIISGMFGQRLSQRISLMAMWGLCLASFWLWPSLLLWCFVVFVMAGRSTPPLNDLTPLSAKRMIIGYLALLLLLSILLPAPEALLQPPQPQEGFI